MNGIEPGDLTALVAAIVPSSLRIGQRVRYWCWEEVSPGVKGAKHHRGVITDINESARQVIVRRWRPEAAPAPALHDSINYTQIVYHSGEPVEQSNEPSTLIDYTGPTKREITLDMPATKEAFDLLKGPYFSVTDTHGSVIEIGQSYDGGMLVLGDGEVIIQLTEADAKRLIHLMHVYWG